MPDKFDPDEKGGEVHPDLAQVFLDHGFICGNNFVDNYDPMHFQLVSGY